MIKPKTQNFRVKVMLIKLEAVNNRVSTRCHASLVIGITSIMQMGMNNISKQLLN